MNTQGILGNPAASFFSCDLSQMSRDHPLHTWFLSAPWHPLVQCQVSSKGSQGGVLVKTDAPVGCRGAEAGALLIRVRVG